MAGRWEMRTNKKNILKILSEIKILKIESIPPRGSQKARRLKTSIGHRYTQIKNKINRTQCFKRSKLMSIHKNIKSFFENEKNIVAVYLFGSYADGRERASSDVDLAILFGNRDRGIVNQMLDKYLVAISRNLRKDTHLTAMDFAGEELLKQIFKKGICLVVNDSKKLAYFKMMAFSKIASFHYYRSQMQSGVVRKVLEGR